MRRTHYVKHIFWGPLCGPGSEGSIGKVLKMDGPSAQGFLSLTALRTEGCGIALTGDEHKVSVTD